MTLIPVVIQGLPVSEWPASQLVKSQIISKILQLAEFCLGREYLKKKDFMQQRPEAKESLRELESVQESWHEMVRIFF